jgi:hypothetical protein
MPGMFFIERVFLGWADVLYHLLMFLNHRAFIIRGGILYIYACKQWVGDWNALDPDILWGSLKYIRFS